MPVEIVPYRSDLVAGMEVRDLTPEMRKLVQSPAYLSALEKVGPGYVLLIEGRPIAAVVFCRLLYQGVAEVVTLFSPDVDLCGRMLHRICVRCFNDVQETHKLHRIEARIAVSAERDRRWAESMGMIPEGTIQAFGSKGEDYVQYARVRKEILCPPC